MARARRALDGGVTLHAKLLAQRLAARSAINVRDDNLVGTLVLAREGVPIRLHLLTMPSPRREELDESGLARLEHDVIKVLGGELDRGRADARDRAQKGKAAKHTCGGAARALRKRAAQTLCARPSTRRGAHLADVALLRGFGGRDTWTGPPRGGGADLSWTARDDAISWRSWQWASSL